MATDFQLAATEPQSQTPQPLPLWLTKWLSNKLEGKGQRKPWGMQSDAFRLLWSASSALPSVFVCTGWEKSSLNIRFCHVSGLCVRLQIKGAVYTVGLGTYSCEMWGDIFKQKRFLGVTLSASHNDYSPVIMESSTVNSLKVNQSKLQWMLYNH